MKPPRDKWQPGTAGNVTTTVEISMSCRCLANMDIVGKSDPMVVICWRPPGSKNWVQRQRTEIIFDDLNPDFVSKVTMDYKFEQVQPLRFEVYDIDVEVPNLSLQDILGVVDTSLGQIVTAGSEGLILDLNPIKITDKPPGTIILTAEELASEKDEVTLRVGGLDIGSWSGFLPPRTFWAISKVNDAGKYILVFRSRDSWGANPNWQSLVMSSRHLCNGEMDRDLKIDVFQRKFSGEISLLASTNLTLRKIMKAAATDRFAMTTPTGKKTDSKIRVISCARNPINTFFEFIRAGTQISTTFAIDFTCSNGDPSYPESLHFISNSGNRPNPYEQAIQAVGLILKDYDNANLFPCFGFGARLPPEGEISMLFNVSMTKAANCNSIAGVLEAYSDMAKTKKEIVNASTYPLSIIIIGVGDADFSLMEELDGDGMRLSYRGKKAARDIVQFVAYRNARSWLMSTGESTVTDTEMAQDESGGADTGQPMAQTVVNTGSFEEKDEREVRLAQSQLAQEVLAEVPAQLCSYMKANGIIPSMLIKQDGGSNDGFGPTLPVREEESNTWHATIWDKINWRLVNIQKRIRPPILKVRFLSYCLKVTPKNEKIYLFKIHINEDETEPQNFEFWHARVLGSQNESGPQWEVQELAGPFKVKTQPLVDFGEFQD